MQIFSIFPYQVLISIIQRAFRALSFDPSDLKHKIFDLLSIRAKFEQIFFDLDLGQAGEFLSDPSKFLRYLMLILNSIARLLLGIHGNC